MATPSSPLGSRQPLKYEHRIKVNDFVRFLKGRKEIRTNLIEIFPGLRVEFVIKKFDEKEKKIFTLKNQQYQVDNVVVTNKQGQQVQRTAGDVLFFLEVESKGRNPSGEKVELAGEVKVDFGGKVEIVKLGHVEKDVYQGFTNDKLTINSGNSVTYHGTTYSKYGTFAKQTDSGFSCSTPEAGRMGSSPWSSSSRSSTPGSQSPPTV